MQATSLLSRRVTLVVIAVWGLLASAVGAFHILPALPPWALPLFLVISISWFASAAFGSGRIHAGLTGISTRALVAAHLVRWVGAYFLWLHAHGRLPYAFAMRAGWGDIIAAAGAMILICLPHAGLRFPKTFIAWNVFSAGDLLLAVGTGGYYNAFHPGSMDEMATLPLTLVPLWLVPVLLVTHFVLIARCLKETSAALPSRT